MYAYVHMYVNIYIYIHIQLCTYIYTYVYMYIDSVNSLSSIALAILVSRTGTCVVCDNSSTYIYACIHECMHFCSMSMYTCVCVYMLIYHTRRRSELKYLHLKIRRLFRRSFAVTGTLFTHVKTCLKLWGLPRKHV